MWITALPKVGRAKGSPNGPPNIKGPQTSPLYLPVWKNSEGQEINLAAAPKTALRVALLSRQQLLLPRPGSQSPEHLLSSAGYPGPPTTKNSCPLEGNNSCKLQSPLLPSTSEDPTKFPEQLERLMAIPNPAPRGCLSVPPAMTVLWLSDGHMAPRTPSSSELRKEPSEAIV